MAITIDLSALGNGTYTVEDDGTPGNGVSIIRDSLGNIVTTFAHPADSLTIIGRAGQNLNINITDSLTTANFTVGSLTSPSARFDNVNVAAVLTSGTVTLTANGTINEFGSDAATDIIAGALLLDAGTGIGTGGNFIETQVSALEAESVTGGIALSNINNLTIGGLTSELRGLFTGTSGNITLINQGSITLNDDDGIESVHSAGNLNLNAVGATADISSIIDQDALFASGNIVLGAGRDILFGTVGANFDNDVRAGGGISITAGRDFHIDGFSDMAADDQGLGSNGGVTISVGRDILIEDDNGTDASIGVSGAGSTGSVVLTTGIGGTLSLAATSSSAIFAGAGGVVVNADRILIESDSGISASGTGSVRLTGVSAGRLINIGSATDGVTAVELSDAELDRIFSQNVIIGSSASGQATVVGAITHSNTNLTIESGADVLVQADVTAPGSLTLRAGDNITQTAASTITTGTMKIVVDTPDFDAPGGTNVFGGALVNSSGTISGNADADTLRATAGNDLIDAGGGADFIWAQQGGVDSLLAGAGNDTAYFGAAWTGGHSMDGGSGDDTMILQGNYNLNGVAGIGGITGLENIFLLGGANTSYGDLAGNTYQYTIATANDDVAAGQRLLIKANGTAGVGGLGATEILNFDGSAETDGYFQVFGGDGGDFIVGGAGDDHLLGMLGNDTLIGGGGNDRLRGDLGADTLQGDAGADLFIYLAANHSTGINFDRIIGFNPGEDQIDLHSAVTGWTGNITTGTLNNGTFDANLAAAVNGALQANSAVLFTPDAGIFAGRTFAVIDVNGDGDYTVGTDYVFEFVTPTSPIDASTAYFI
jgi:Ca2+-binding RTX toxin-like protein